MTSPVVILVVDDSPIQRRIVWGTLKAEGYRVLVAENGRQGVDMALQYHPDLILMDISMPEMDGLSAVRELRRHPEMAEVPILALTAATHTDELEEAYQAGYSGALGKSSSRAALVEKVHEWLSR